MNKFSVRCPQCAAKLKAEDRILGQSVPCPKCQTPILIQRPESVSNSTELQELIPLNDDPLATGGDVATDPLFNLGNVDLNNFPAVDLSATAPTLASPLSSKSISSSPRTRVSQPEPEPEAEPIAGKQMKFAILAGGIGLVFALVLGTLSWWLMAPRGEKTAEVARATPPSASKSKDEAAQPEATGKSTNSVDTTTTALPATATPASVGSPLIAASSVPMPEGSESQIEPKGAGSVPPPVAVPLPTVPPETSPPADAPAVAPNPAPAPAALPPGPAVASGPAASAAFSIDRLKAATVFIKVTTKKGGQTGSGFLIEKEADRGLVATNAHVVMDDADVGTKIECIFNSGTSKETTGTAAVVGLDEGEDLAILKVQHPELPEPLDIRTPVVPTETLSVFVVGFPFGSALATNRKNPAITITKGSVSSIRRDEFDRIAIVQIDGGINPGNSGGPVVTEDGKLIGVAVAKLLGSEIGFAIPRDLLSEVLAGRVTGLAVRSADSSARSPQHRVRVEIVDPKKNVTDVAVLTCEVADVSVKAPQADGKWSQVFKDMVETRLTLNGKSAEGIVNVPDHPSGCMLQVRLTRKDGKFSFAAPVDLKTLKERSRKSPPPTSIAPRTPSQPKPPDLTENDPNTISDSDANRKVLKLPAVYSTAFLGGHGRYLFLHLKTLKKLAVVDLVERATLKFLDVGEDVVCAAGAEKLVVVVPSQKLIQRWSLETFEREIVKTLDLDVPPTVVAMGAASAGPVFVGGGEQHQGRYQLVDLKTLKSIPITGDDGNRQRFEVSADSPVRASADGHVFTTWRLGGSPSGFYVMQVSGSQLTTRYEHTSVGYISPSAEGDRIYTAQGIYTPQIKLIGENKQMFATSFPIPAVTGRFFLRVQRGDNRSGRGDASPQKTALTIHLADQDGALLTVPNVDMRQGEYSDFHGRDPICLDQRIYFHPSANVLATLPMSNDSVIFRDLNLVEELDRIGVDYLYVVSQPPHSVNPGKALEYQIEAKSKSGGLKFKLSSGPPKMQLSATGLLKWTPASSDSSPQNVIVVVSDESGQEVFHTFEVEINRPESAASKSTKSKSGDSATATNKTNPSSNKSGNTALASEKQRTWTDVNGRTIMGTLVRIDDDRIMVKRETGQTVAVKLDQLSKQDQQYVKSRSKK